MVGGSAHRPRMIDDGQRPAGAFRLCNPWALRAREACLALLLLLAHDITVGSAARQEPVFELPLCA